jgi:hypothetical protein
MAKLSYGALFVSSPSATTLGAATPAKAAGTTTALELGDFTHADNRLTYTQATTRDFLFALNATLVKAAGSDSVVTLHVYKNGSTSVISEPYDLTRDIVLDQDGNVHNDDIPIRLSLTGTVELAQNDYLEVWLETDTGDDVTLQVAQMTVKVAG